MAVNELLVLTPNEKIIKRDFLFSRLISPDFIWLVNSSTYGAKMPRASWQFIGNQFIGIPPTQEQTEIAKHIAEESKVVDKGISKAEKEEEAVGSILEHTAEKQKRNGI